MMQPDPFSPFRQSTPAYTAETDADGRGLTLIAIDVARFHSVAHEAIAVAN